MIKHILAIIVVSIIVIVGMPYVQQGLHILIAGHDWLSNLLTNVFSGGQAGNITRQLIALLAIPVVVALIPTIIFWLAKRAWFPYFMELVWVIWLVQTSALVVLYKAAA